MTESDTTQITAEINQCPRCEGVFSEWQKKSTSLIKYVPTCPWCGLEREQYGSYFTADEARELFAELVVAIDEDPEFHEAVINDAREYLEGDDD